MALELELGRRQIHHRRGFAGSLLALVLAAALGGRLLARDHTPLLLAGVMLAAGFGALIALVLSVTPAERLPGMLFFMFTDNTVAAMMSLFPRPW